VLAPGELRPHGFYRSDSQAAPMLTIDGAFVVHPYFELGTYAHFAAISVQHESRSTSGRSRSGRVIG
jgi:hypothetical protein